VLDMMGQPHMQPHFYWSITTEDGCDQQVLTVVGFTASGPMASGSSLDLARLTFARPSVSSTTMTRPQSPCMPAHECFQQTERVRFGECLLLAEQTADTARVVGCCCWSGIM